MGQHKRNTVELVRYSCNIIFKDELRMLNIRKNLPIKLNLRISNMMTRLGKPLLISHV